MKRKRKLNLSLWKYPIVLGLFLFLTGIMSVGAQNQTIGGSVYDEAGEPLIGTAVTLKNTSKGTITDFNGNFKLEAPIGSIIVLRFVGYKVKEMKVTNANLGKIILEENSSTLEEVVVVGYGTQRKKDIAGAISSVDEKMLSQKVPVSVADALQGNVAGMLVTSSSGAPGQESKIVIRGLSTFESGVNPLYVVDGILMENISMINPNDITNVEVLKDAASASIYGARAANGVILITTKSGAVGSKSRINVTYVNSYGTLANKLPQMNREESDIFENTIVSASTKNQFQWFKNATDTVNLQGRTSNDYQDLISQVSVRNDANISMQTGTDKLNIYASLGLLDDKGIILTSYAKRYTGRLKTIYNINPYVKFTTNITAGFQNGNNISEGNTFYNALRRPVKSLIYFPDGTLVPRWNSNPSGKRNPLIELYDRSDVTSRYSAQFYQGVEIKLKKYFTLNASASADVSYSDRIGYTDPLAQGSSEADFQAGLDKGNEVLNFRTTYLTESYLRYNQKFAGKHNLEMMAGLSSEKNDNLTPMNISMQNFLIKNDNMHVPQLLVPPAGSEIVSLSVNKTGSTTIGASQFGRIAYDYMSRYILRASVRRDGSSVFGSGNRWGIFPSVSGAWRFSDEFFMDWSKAVVTDAKVRVSWGQAGNDRIPPYDWRTMYAGSINASYSGTPGVYPNSQLGNIDLKWETTTQSNYGLDLTLFDGRLTLTADAYVKLTADLLNKEPLPSELGYTSRRINWGSVENRGLEISISAVPIDTKTVTWNTTINWSRNKNKIVSLYGDPYAYQTDWWVEAGMAAGNFYGYKDMGIYSYDVSNAWTEDFKTRLIPVFARDNYGNVKITKSNGPELLGYQFPDGRDYGWVADGSGNKIYQVVKGGTTTPFKGGDVIWSDANHDGVIDAADKQILGNAQNDWYAGWNNSVRWKNITLTVNMYASWGGLVYNTLLYDLTKYGDNTSNPDPRPITQTWRYQGQITDWYAAGNNARTTENGRSLNSFYLEDASFIRLQSVRLDYQLESRITKILHLQNLRVFAYGNNLATWTNYRGYDPEISTGGVLNPGADTQKYPKKREFGFGLNLSY